MSTLSRWLFTALALFILLAPPVRAQEEGAEPEGAAGVMDTIDTAFGQYLVAPIYSVLFFDLYPFDNTLDGDDALEPLYNAGKLDIALQRQERKVGEAGAMDALLAQQLDRYAEKRASDPEASSPSFDRAVSIDDEGDAAIEHYSIADKADLLPLLTEPVPHSFGPIQTEIHREGDQLVATAIGGQVDLPALGVQLGGAELVSADGSEVLVRVEHPDLPGIELTVATDGTVRGGSGPVPNDTLALVAGMAVSSPEGNATIAATGANDYAWIATAGAPVATPIANPRNMKVPLVVVWLVLGALFFTLRLAFVNVRMFGHAIAVTAGKYDNDEDPGEISHFQALASALSATVGLGNIAGVAIAVSMGGPGAVFWMVMAGALGMSSKFVECTLGQMYRRVAVDGVVSGGPMHYLSRGVTDQFERWLGRAGRPLGAIIGYPLGILFAVMCVGASLGGGNMFQANQSFAALADVATRLVPSLNTPDTIFWMSLVYGIVLAALVGVVILGGIKRIGVAAGFIVPIMCGVYVIAGMGVLIININAVPAAFLHIIGEAFSPEAGLGGLFGVLIVGFQRAAFSNEAGVGSASVAHSAASTPEPVREGIVALLEPFIDTIVVCTMTGLVVVVTGAYQQDTGDGVLMTSYAFATVFSWFPYVLSLAVVLFAFSTMISWSYYGERAIVWMLGEWAKWPYKVVFVIFIVFGAVFKLGNVLDFSDLMVLGMALPNIFGAVLLSGHVAKALATYRKHLADGDFDEPAAAK